jgi:hypothetical protein
MSRHRLLGHLVGRISFEFAEEAHALRRRIATRVVTEPDLAFQQVASKGYEAVLEHVFTEGYRELVLP